MTRIDETANSKGSPGQEQISEAILVVEDDLALLKAIQTCLEEHGYRTEGVTSGAAALRWLEDHSARLMLLDYRLPDMLGEELLARLDAQGMEVPFVVATGHGSDLAAAKMMKRGARDYLVKGTSFMNLLPRVLDEVFARLKHEQRLAETEDDLRQAYDELEKRVRQRTAELAHLCRLSTVGEMVAELAHELNQPLAAISSYAQACVRLLQSRADDASEDLLASMEQISGQADRAGEIVRRLRRFVTKAEPTWTILDINTLVREIAGLVEGEACSRRVEMRFELTEPCPPVRGDRVQIEQVLVNLIRNGLEAMWELAAEPRVLTICTTADHGDRIEVAVRDTGAGIPAEKLERVFDRFFTTKPDGMGMGLSISRSIIESHGGRLWATPGLDRGATFRFTLPIHHGDSAGAQ